MSLLAFEPTRLDALRRAMASAAAALSRLSSSDPDAASAVTAVRRACSVLADGWVARAAAVATSPAWFDYRAAPLAGAWRAADDPLSSPIPRCGALALQIPDDASVQSFPIPVWHGWGTTRLQWFIDDDEVCLSDIVAGVGCGNGDDRPLARGDDLSDVDLAARVRVVLDHEAGVAVVVAYPTHGDDGDIPALPVELTVDGPVQLPDDFPSQLRVWTTGEGIDGNVVFDYRFLNSMTPGIVGGVAPAIQGAIRVRRAAGGEVDLDGRLGQYPTVEVIRDVPVVGGFHSTLIHVRQQESGGPLNLFEPPQHFEAHG